MRERLDCAVLGTICSEDWVGEWMGAHAGGRLHLHHLDDHGSDIGSPDSFRGLLQSSMRLRRFDACIVPVSGSSLGWARTTLSMAQGALHTPIIALVRDLKAAAIDDLYAVGMADFIRAPVCVDELRARVERLLDARRYQAGLLSAVPSLGEAGVEYTGGANEAPSSAQDALCATILERSGNELEAFAIASASRCATSKESFRSAKSKVIERFERAYITAALGRHSGNIAMAARAAQKHRRAFWALMRKHEIDAAPFRSDDYPGRARES